ncbi:hypothetical protein LINPERPRIM_LOCUS29246 [Linum perenne]
MGLRQFPPPGQESEEVRILGRRHRRHRRNRQRVRFPAREEGYQLGHRRPEP